jgi:EmrB/QacA subfamily drug resistance transporter
VNAYVLTFGGFLLLGGRAADLVGRRTVFVFGLAIFTVASLACGFASSQWMLVTARAVQGIGGAIVQAVALSLILDLFQGTAARARAMSVWGFVASAGGAVGVVLGGVLTQAGDWHLIFLLNVPIGLIAIALARPLLPGGRGVGLDEGVDIGGAITITVAPILAVYGILTASESGWSSPEVIGCLGLALVVLAAFVAIERRARNPIVPLRIFRSAAVSISNVVMVFMMVAFFGWFFFSPLYAQHILGYGALETGLTFLPATLTMGALSLGLAAKVVTRFGPKRPLVGGMLLFTVGLLVFARAPVNGAFVPDILVPMFLLGLSAGISFMPLFLIATAEVSPEDSGLVSGLISTSQMIGGALGLALLAGLAAAQATSMASSGVPQLEAINDGYHAAFVLGAVLSLVTAVLAATQLPQTKLRTSAVSASSSNGLLSQASAPSSLASSKRP